MSLIEKKDGPCVVLAGAGTGKTHTIVEKITYLIKNKIYAPERIVCITFSNEAASNVFLRVQKSLALEGKQPLIKTFHAFAADLLRAWGHYLGIAEDFKILDPDQAKVVLHRYLKIAPYYCHTYVHTLGIAKDLGITLADIDAYMARPLEAYKDISLEKRLEDLQFRLQTLYLQKGAHTKEDLVEEITLLSGLMDLKKFRTTWNAYEKLKVKQGYLDYADLTTQALQLLQQHPEIAEHYSYIIVDEFQDTNKVQLDFLFHLAPHRRIMIVGDLNQSIYRFRGAYRDNFRNFQEHFNVKQEDIFHLTHSHRSPNKVLRAAHKLITYNYERPDESFLVENAYQREGVPLEVYGLMNAQEEARKVVELIQKELVEGKKPEDICVLFRTHQQGRVIKRALESQHIPYASVSKYSLLKHPVIRTVIDYLTIVHTIQKKSKGGEQAWWDLLYQMHFSEQDLVLVGKFIKEHKDDASLSILMYEKLLSSSLSSNGLLSAKVIIERLKQLLIISESNVLDFLPRVYAFFGYTGKQVEEKEDLLNCNRFYDLAVNHAQFHGPDLGSFLHYLAILDQLEIDVEAAELHPEGVHLMTLHATKGLEYPVVIVTNMVQKRFPLERMQRRLLPLELYPDLKDMAKDEDALKAYERKHHLFEERRLAYVAFTRAREKLILTYASQYSQKKHLPSQFLEELEYTNNPDIIFSLDENLKYVEVESGILAGQIRSSFNFLGNDRNQMILPLSKPFSPSSLVLFIDCQKRYEYQYVYHMPEPKTLSWDALRLGSFVHVILEKGVQSHFSQLEQFLHLAYELQRQEDWQSVNLEEALPMIKIFFERHKDKYGIHSLTEQLLKVDLAGIPFIGFADRIDVRPEGVEIIDYKTGRLPVTPMHRNWQLGYYALAARKLGYKVHKLTLEMLRHEKPLEFIIDSNGNARAVHSQRMEFVIDDIEKSLIATAQRILKASKDGFQACPVEKNCAFCNEYVYKM